MNKIPWWLVLVLAGGFATAAWWVGEQYIDEKSVVIIDKQSGSNDKISETKNSVNGDGAKTNRQNKQSYEDRDSPIIYQRESY